MRFGLSARWVPVLGLVAVGAFLAPSVHSLSAPDAGLAVSDGLAVPAHPSGAGAPSECGPSDRPSLDPLCTAPNANETLSGKMGDDEDACLEGFSSPCAAASVGASWSVSNGTIAVAANVSHEIDVTQAGSIKVPVDPWEGQTKGQVSAGVGRSPEARVGTDGSEYGADAEHVWWRQGPDAGWYLAQFSAEDTSGEISLSPRTPSTPAPGGAQPGVRPPAAEPETRTLDRAGMGARVADESESSEPGPSAPTKPDASDDRLPPPVVLSEAGREPTPADRLLWAVGWTLSIGIAATSALYSLWHLGAGLFTRLRRDRLLDLRSRGEILDALRATPWATLSALGTATGLARSSLRYHLRILCSHGLVATHRAGRAVRYADRTAGPLPACPDPVRRILEEELSREDWPLSRLIRRVMDRRACSRSGAWRAIRASAVRGFVDVRRRGREVFVALVPDPVAPGRPGQ